MYLQTRIEMVKNSWDGVSDFTHLLLFIIFNLVRPIRPVECNDWFTHQIWDQFHQLFVSKCMETAQLISGQEIVGIQQHMTKKVYQAWRIPWWAQPDKMFVWKCTETAWPSTDQETVRIQWSKTKRESGLGRPTVSSPTKLCSLPHSLVVPNQTMQTW